MVKQELDFDEMITNIFWADHQMITDYGLFSDIVLFDTKFQTNKEMTVIFGVALLYDETTASFEWPFETFLHAMSGKKPINFFTD
ncbi:hypothetical protein ACSBR2_023451 [Camellia fascicularis]